MFGASVEVLEIIHGLSPSSIVKTDEKYLLKVLAISSGVRPPSERQPQKLHISYASLCLHI